MKKFTKIADIQEDGLYWYWASGKSRPEPVLIHKEKQEGFFFAFNGSRQSWLRNDEYLEGPAPEPQRDSSIPNDGQA
jgi:hypothetical protein